jgi:hypothetical protein
MMHLNNSIRYKRSFVNINPQSNTDFTQVTCTVHFYYSSRQTDIQTDRQTDNRQTDIFELTPFHMGNF